MPSTGIVSGTKVRLSIEGAAVARATNCKLSIKNDLRVTSHKDQTGDFETSQYGDFSGDLSSDFLFEETAGGLEDLMVLFLAKTTVDFIFGSGVTGDLKLTGTANIESLDWDATVKENTKASIKLKITAVPTVGAFA